MMKFSVKRLLAVAKKEFRQIKRDKVVLRIPLMMPIIWLFVLSYAFVVTPKNLTLYVLDQANAPVSRTIVKKINANTRIKVVNDSDDSGNQLLISVDKVPELTLDGSRFVSARALESELKQTLASAVGMSVSYTRDIDQYTDWFVIPGVIGLVLQNIITFLTALSIVKEKEKGTYQHLLFSPISFFEIIVGKLIPYFLIGLVDLVLLVFLSRLSFNVDIVGVFFPYLAAGSLFILSALMFGILISSLAKNQMQALLLTVFLLLPSVLCSDFVFPVASMPGFLRILSAGMPLTYFNELSRELIINRADLTTLMSLLAALGSIIVATMALSIFVLKRQRVV